MIELFPDNNLSATHELLEIDKNNITIEQVKTPVIVKLQKIASKAIWRPSPGRKLGFLIKHKNKLIGIIFLSSPVINMKVRDKYLNLSNNPTEKGYQLKDYFDLSVCVGIQPLAWFWNIGKLVALLAPTLEDFIVINYPECNFKGVITTSLYGHGSQYNRIYKFLGYTEGFGHCHISDEKYKEMMKWMKNNNHEIPSCSFGSGSNPRMRRISAYIKASGDKTLSLKHNIKRGVFFHKKVSSELRQEVIDEWYRRWGKPRYDRKRNEIPPYNNGLE